MALVFPINPAEGDVFVISDGVKYLFIEGAWQLFVFNTPESTFLNLKNTDNLIEGQVNKFFTENRVRSSILTGLNKALGGEVSASDSLVIGISKLQKQAIDQKAAIDAISTGGVLASQIGQANGVAGLDATGVIFAHQLPSYVDDVIEVATSGALPAVGESGKIYITLNDNHQYRWSGTQYVDITQQGSWTTLLGKPTTVAGFGITDSFTKSEVSAAINNAFNRTNDKGVVNFATTVNYNVLGGNTSPVDGNWIPTNSRAKILLLGQTNPAENGPWVEGGGGWGRPAEFATGLVSAGAKYYVLGGTHANEEYTLISQGSLIVAYGTAYGLTPGGSALYFMQSNLSTAKGILTGLDKTSGDEVQSGDTVLSAIGKLQKQLLEQALAISNVTASGGIQQSQIGVANGVASLGADAKIPAIQLPSYVDDVLEFSSLAEFPAVGERGKIYVDVSTDFDYRWTGSVYRQILSSPGTTDAVTEGAVNKYFTAARAQAAVTSVTGNAGTATKLATARVISVSGVLSGSASFDGSGDVTINVTGSLPYDIGGSIFGQPAANEVLLRSPACRAYTIPVNQANAQARANVAPTNAAVFIIAKNGTQVGTITFAAGQAVGTVSLTGAVSMSVGDLLSVTAPAVADASLSDVDVSLLANT